MDLKKVIGAVALGAIAVGAIAHDVLEKPDIVKEIEYRNITSTEIVNNTVEVEVEKIVEVDNGNLELVLNEIYDNDGSVEYLIDDLDDDELDQVVDRIVFVNDIKALAVAEADKEVVDLLHKEDINGTTLDEDDIERVRVQDDDDEVTVDDIDYEDKDADVFVDVNFEQDDVKYVAVVKVEIKDAEVDDADLVSIALR